MSDNKDESFCNIEPVSPSDAGARAMVLSATLAGLRASKARLRIALELQAANDQEIARLRDEITHRDLQVNSMCNTWKASGSLDQESTANEI